MTYLPHSTWKHSLVGFVPKTSQLITAIGDETHLTDVQSGKRVRSFPGTGPLSPDGKTLATWDPKAKTTRLWEVASGKELFNLGPVGDEAIFHPDSETLVTLRGSPRKVAEDFFIRFWDRKTGKLHGTLDPYTTAIPGWSWKNILEAHRGGSYKTQPLDSYCVEPLSLQSFSPDGEILACVLQQVPLGDGNRHPRTLLWSVRERRFLFKLEGHPLSFSPDSKKIATAVRLPDGDRLRPGVQLFVIRLWDVTSGKQVLDLAGASSFPEARFFPDGKTVYSAPWAPDGQRVRFWDAQTGREQGVFYGYDGGRLAFSLDSKTLVSVSGRKTTLWDMATAVKTDVPGKAIVSEDALGRMRLTFGQGKSMDLAQPTQTSPDGKTHPPENRYPNGGTFSPDGRYLALGREDGTILLWTISPAK